MNKTIAVANELVAGLIIIGILALHIITKTKLPKFSIFD
jgi:hypothetical protein